VDVNNESVDLAAFSATDLFPTWPSDWLSVSQSVCWKIAKQFRVFVLLHCCRDCRKAQSTWAAKTPAVRTCNSPKPHDDNNLAELVITDAFWCITYDRKEWTHARKRKCAESAEQSQGVDAPKQALSSNS